MRERERTIERRGPGSERVRSGRVAAVGVPLAALVLVAVASAFDGAKRGADPTVTAARDLVAKLTPASRERAVFPFEGAERENWAFVPREREGLPIRDMSADERAALQALLKASLSAQGVRTVEGIRGLESVLRGMESTAEREATWRDPELYYVSVFGKPGEGPWGWRFEGHHLSLNFTWQDGALVAHTPFFVGANPREIREGPRKGFRVLADREDAARAVLAAMTDEERGKAVQPGPPGEVLLVPGRAVEPMEPAGVPGSELGAPAQAALLALVRAHLAYLRDDQRAAALARVKDAGELSFLWLGGTAPGEPHYYRVQGPAFLIEWDDSRPGVNHAHCVVHDPKNDFGHDVLREHLRREHGVGAPDGGKKG